MAGGMNKRGSFRLPMAERVALSKGASVEPLDDCPGRHVWVLDPPDGSAGRRPGLLIEWQQTASGWQGRVVHAAQFADAWVTVEEWLPVSALTPA
jgi:hypothetical protein